MNINTKNYFEIFSLAEAFQIDLDLLSREYKSLQTQYHPDKYINADDQSRLFALQTSSIVNEGFECLKSPLKRAAYLLSLHDVDAEENNQAHLGNEFLIKHIELREQLESIAENDEMEALDILKADIEKETQGYLGQFEALYKAQAYQTAKPIYSKLQFLYKLLREIDSVEEKLLDY